MVCCANTCYDRVLIFGSLHPFCYAKGMTNYLYQHGIRILRLRSGQVF